MDKILELEQMFHKKQDELFRQKNKIMFALEYVLMYDYDNFDYDEYTRQYEYFKSENNKLHTDYMAKRRKLISEGF